MSNQDEFKDGEFKGRVIGELEALKAQYSSFSLGQSVTRDSIDNLIRSIEAFKLGIGERVGKSEGSIIKLDTEMSIIKYLLGGILLSILILITTAVVKLVMK